MAAEGRRMGVGGTGWVRWGGVSSRRRLFGSFSEYGHVRLMAGKPGGFVCGQTWCGLNGNGDVR